MSIRLTAYLVVAAVIAGLGAALWHTMHREARWQAQADSYAASMLEQSRQVSKLADKVKAGDAAHQRSLDDLAHWQSRYNSLRRKYEDFDRWASIPLPEPASDLVCGKARCTSGNVPGTDTQGGD